MLHKSSKQAKEVSTVLISTVRDLFKSGKIDKSVARYVFDWKKAAQIISERKPYIAYAGYMNSFRNNNYLIYQGGIPVYPTELLMTDKDIPVLALNENQRELIPCYVREYEDYEITWTPDSLKLLTTKIDAKEHNYDTGRETDSTASN